jgi:hypothetical protein
MIENRQLRKIRIQGAEPEALTAEQYKALADALMEQQRELETQRRALLAKMSEAGIAPHSAELTTLGELFHRVMHTPPTECIGATCQDTGQITTMPYSRSDGPDIIIQNVHNLSTYVPLGRTASAAMRICAAVGQYPKLVAGEHVAPASAAFVRLA